MMRIEEHNHLFTLDIMLIYCLVFESYDRDEHEATEEDVQESSRKRSLYDHGL